MSHEAMHYCRGGTDCRETHHHCRMVTRRGDPEKLRPLVKDAKYFCKKCGRTAHKNENLCKPATL